jgi:hypothetical protein
MSKDTGGPAFPLFLKQDEILSNEGMTIRDYFAIHADVPWDFMVRSLESEFGTGNVPIKKGAEFIAEVRYAMADAMIAERSK